MPTNTSFVTYGKIFDIDKTSSAGANIAVFLYNKTKDEIISGNTSGSEDLITDANSEFQGNLGNFETQWVEADEIYLSCRKGSKTALNRFIITGTGGHEINLTLEELEPVMNIVKFLRMRMRDFNTSRGNTTTMIYPYYPRAMEDLEKTDFPRIGIQKMDEDTASAGITSNQSAKQIIRLKLLSVVWAKKSDFQKFTVDDVDYEGTGLLDKVSREVSDALREGFYKRPRYTQDPHLQAYYAYISDRNENLEFDEEEGLPKNEIEIQFEFIRQS